LCCRDTTRGAAAAKAIKDAHPALETAGDLVVQELRLDDLRSVLRAVKGIKSTLGRASLDILVLNAGVISRQLNRTVQGFEEGWGVNLVGHYVLTQKLLPLTTDTSRIVAVSSVAHLITKKIGDDPDFEERAFSGWQSYGQSKLGAILYMKYLARNPSLFKGKAYSVHPGAIATKLQNETTLTKMMFGLFWWATKTPEQGAATSVYACTDLCDAPSGSYLADCKVHAGWCLGKQALDDANGDEMVALVEAGLRRKFPEFFAEAEVEVEVETKVAKEALSASLDMSPVFDLNVRPPMQVTRKGTAGTAPALADEASSIATRVAAKVSRATSLATSAAGDSDDDGVDRKDSIAAFH